LYIFDRSYERTYRQLRLLPAAKREKCKRREGETGLAWLAPLGGMYELFCHPNCLVILPRGATQPALAATVIPEATP